MRIHRLLTGLALVLVLGCGEPARHEVVMSGTTECMQKMADAVAAVTDGATAEAAVPRILEVAPRWRALNRERRDLLLKHPDLDVYFRQNGAALQAATVRYYDQTRRIEKIPGGPAFLQRISPEMNIEKP